jgi:hypothetical protein
MAASQFGQRVVLALPEPARIGVCSGTVGVALSRGGEFGEQRLDHRA